MSHFRYRGHLDEPVEQIKPAITQVVEQKPFLVQNPDPLLGFLLYSKQKQAIKTAANRVLDW